MEEIKPIRKLRKDVKDGDLVLLLGDRGNIRIPGFVREEPLANAYNFSLIWAHKPFRNDHYYSEKDYCYSEKYCFLENNELLEIDKPHVKYKITRYQVLQRKSER